MKRLRKENFSSGSRDICFGCITEVAFKRKGPVAVLRSYDRSRFSFNFMCPLREGRGLLCDNPLHPRTPEALPLDSVRFRHTLPILGETSGGGLAPFPYLPACRRPPLLHSRSRDAGVPRFRRAPGEIPNLCGKKCAPITGLFTWARAGSNRTQPVLPRKLCRPWHGAQGDPGRSAAKEEAPEAPQEILPDHAGGKNSEGTSPCPRP